MSTALPEMPSEKATSENAPAGPSSLQRIVNIFTAPSRAFENLGRNPSWAAPWLLASVFALIFGAIFVNKVDMVHFSRQQIEQSARAEAQFEKNSPEQQETQLRITAKFTEIVSFLAPVFLLLGGLVIAAVFMVVFNFGFGAEVPFKVCLAIVFYAWLPLVASSILTSTALALNSDPNSFNVRNPIATNPAYFMDPNSQKFLYGMASGLDVFNLWIMVLLGMGFAVNSSRGKLAQGTAITTALVVYAVYILGRAALSSAF